MNQAIKTDAVTPAGSPGGLVQSKVARLFATCSRARNPVLAFSRACSRVGFMARRYEGATRFYCLESALNEQKHMLLATRYSDTAAALRHSADCSRDLKAFYRACARP